MLKIATTSLLMLFSSMIAIAQDGRQLLSKIELEIQEKEPKWRFEQKSANESDVLMLLLYSEVPAGTASYDVPNVIIIIQIGGSIKKAKGRFKEVYRRSRRVKGKMVKLTDFGEEGFYAPVGLTQIQNATLFFRADKINVQVYAPSEEMARRFAKLVAGQLPAI